MKKKLIIFTALLIPGFFSVLIFVSNYPVHIVKENIWAIGIYEGRSPLHFFEPLNIKNPVITASDVTDVKALFVADPFLFRKDNTWYMFFEVLNTLSGHGDIGLATSGDGVKWNYERIVLDEVFHLSYPYIFQHEGTVYMIPESATAGMLNLYREVEFPYEWECAATLLHGQFGDHGILRYNDTWYLFACSQPYTHNTLRLYYSDDLFGDWTEHPASPVVADDANKARPGGRIVIWKNRVVRYSQDCNPTYGKSLNAFEITRLTKTEYSEQESSWNPVIRNSGSGWNRHGMHHLDAYQDENQRWIGCVDGYIRQFIIKVDY